MRRSLTILVWIFIGAIAATIGLGYFFYIANQDRAELAEQVKLFKEEALRAHAAKEQIETEKQSELAQAQEALRASEEKLKAYHAYQDKQKQAKPIHVSDPRVYKQWKDLISVSLGASLKIPSNLVAENTTSSLQIRYPSDDPFLTLQPYASTTEQTMLAEVYTPQEPVNYLLDGAVASGVRGGDGGIGSTIYVLRIMTDQGITHLLKFHTNLPSISDKEIFSIIASLRLRP